MQQLEPPGTKVAKVETWKNLEKTSRLLPLREIKNRESLVRRVMEKALDVVISKAWLRQPLTK